MATLAIDPAALERLKKQLGGPTNEALARKMKINPATVSRVLSGKSAPGTSFIAGAMLAFGSAWICELFTVVER